MNARVARFLLALAAIAAVSCLGSGDNAIPSTEACVSEQLLDAGSVIVPPFATEAGVSAQPGAVPAPPDVPDAESLPSQLLALNAVIDELATPLSDVEIRARYKVYPAFNSPISDASMVIYAELHNRPEVIRDEAQVLQALVKPNAPVLFEANRGGESYRNCAARVTLDLMAARQVHALGAGYDPDANADYVDGLITMFSRAVSVADFSRLALSRAACGGWDDQTSVALTFDGGKRRNDSLVTSLRDATSGGRQVHLIAGVLHTPPGDFVACTSLLRNFSGRLSPQQIGWMLRGGTLEAASASFDGYYSAMVRLRAAADTGSLASAPEWVLQARAAAQIAKERYACGSTEAVYRFLVGKSFAILVPNIFYRFKFDTADVASTIN